MAAENTIATAYIQLVPTLTGVQGAIGEALSGGSATQEAEQAGSKIGGSLLDGLKKVAGPAAIAGIAAGLFSIGSTFDDVSDSIRVATGKTGADLDGMVAQAKTIGTTIPVEFDKIGPALSQVSTRLGLTGDDLTTVTSQFLAAGNVLGKDVDIDKATASFNAFGLKGADVSTALDDIFKVSQSTGVGFDEITSAVQASAPALQQLGFSFQDSAALVGQLDKAGLNSTATLGAMSKGMVKLAKDGKDPQTAFKEITGQISDLVGQGKDAEAIDLAAGLFGTKGAAQFVQATKEGALNLTDLTGAMDANSESILGAQDDTADFAESWTLFKNKAMVAIEPVATAVFNFAGTVMQKLLDAFDNVGGAVDAVVGFFTDYKDVLIPLGVVVLGLTANIIAQTVATAANAVVTKAVAVATQIWTVAQKALNLVLKSNPIGLVVAAIAALVAGVIWAYENVGWFRDIVDKAWKVISDAASWAWEHVIKPVFDALSTAVSTVIDWFSHFGENLSGILDNIGGWISDAWTAILDFFTSLPGKVWGILVTAAETIAEYGWKFIDWYYGGIIRGAIQLFEWFGQLAGWVWDKIVAFAGWISDRAVEFIGWFWNGIVAGAQAIWDFFTAMPGTIWGIFMGFETWLGDRMFEFAHWLLDGIVDGAQAIWDFFSGVPQKIWNVLLGMTQYVMDRGGEFIGWLAQGINTGAQGIWDFFTNLPTTIWTGILKIKDQVLGWGKQIVDWMAKGISDGAHSVLDAIAGLFTGVAFTDNGELSAANGYTVAVGMGAGGGVLPGYAPGVDDQLAVLSRGEGVLVPEAVRMLGKDWVYGINKAARGGRYVSPDSILGYATGGVVGDVGRDYSKYVSSQVKSGGKGWVHDLTEKLFGTLVKDALGSGVSFDGVLNVDGIVVPLPVGARGEFMKAVASQMGTPYVWGGASPPGFDCSGLMSWALNQAGVGKGRQTADGFNQSQPHVNAAKPGDMVTFDTGRLGAGVAAHIGAVLDPTRSLMMHTDGAGPARVSDYRTRDGGPLSILDAIGGAVSGLGKVGSAIMAKMSVGSLNNATGPSGEGAVVGGSGWERWRGTVLQALSLAGQSADNVDAVLNQIRTESSGDPRAINLTDINAQRGHPSKGLIQAIDSTFQQYRLPQLANDIYDPLANIVAGIRYAVKTYGSIRQGMRGVAYDDGGWLMPESRPVNMLREPEPVLTPQQWRVAERAIDEASSGRGGANYQWNVVQQPGQSPAQLAREMNRLLMFSAGRTA